MRDASRLSSFQSVFCQRSHHMNNICRSDDGVDYYLLFKVGPIACSEPPCKMKCVIPEISYHNRDPVLSVDFQVGLITTRIMLSLIQ